MTYTMDFPSMISFYLHRNPFHYEHSKVKHREGVHKNACRFSEKENRCMPD